MVQTENRAKVIAKDRLFANFPSPFPLLLFLPIFLHFSTPRRPSWTFLERLVVDEDVANIQTILKQEIGGDLKAIYVAEPHQLRIQYSILTDSFRDFLI